MVGIGHARIVADATSDTRLQPVPAVASMEPMTSVAFEIQPIDPATADRLRRAGGVPYVADEFPGYPCRQCLLDAQVGDELLLVSHDPFETDSPYRSASPIFIHASPCTPYAAQPELPPQLTRRQLSVRGFDDGAMMLDAAVIDGGELAATIDSMFADPRIAWLHVHNATRGCWATTIARGDVVSAAAASS
jgi:hypothetical protein